MRNVCGTSDAKSARVEAYAALELNLVNLYCAVSDGNKSVEILTLRKLIENLQDAQRAAIDLLGGVSN
jgi:hypothetical protein